MLKHLYIKNFALIDELSVDFNPGFSVITGETGAGKSIILGAIGLLKGQRADTKSIKLGESKCIVEAYFDIKNYSLDYLFESNEIETDHTECIIRREISSSGKSRAFINDTPVSLSLLKEFGELLIDIHSQHQNLLLSKQDFQLEVIDIIANDKDSLNDYKASFQEYKNKERELNQLREEIAANKVNVEFLQYQYDELSGSRLDINEQEELELISNQMSHSEDIKSALYTADNALSGEETGISNNLKKAISSLKSIENVMPEVTELASRMESCNIELKDIAAEISVKFEKVNFNPAELDSINNRLDTIYSLEKKYHCDTIAELLEKQESIEQQLSLISNSDYHIEVLEKELAEKLKITRNKALLLSNIRKEISHKIEQDIMEMLLCLGMPNVRFSIEITPTELGLNGQDKVAFMFSANKGGVLQPVQQVASGGEIARLMLSLKAMISGTVKLPTIIFDEIDTGVSGAIAEKMGHIMKDMGNKDRQVISITHLPQIAALGSTHYKVYKDDFDKETSSHIKQLTKEERIIEIAQMLSGSGISEAAMNNAKELLKI